MVKIYELLSVFWFAHLYKVDDGTKVVLNRFLNDENRPGASEVYADMVFPNWGCADKFLARLCGVNPLTRDLNAMKAEVEEHYQRWAAGGFKRMKPYAPGPYNMFG